MHFNKKVPCAVAHWSISLSSMHFFCTQNAIITYTQRGSRPHEFWIPNKNKKFGSIQCCMSDPFLGHKSDFWFSKLPKKLNHNCFFKLNEFLEDIFWWPNAGGAFHYLSNCKTVLLHFFAGAGGGGASNGNEVVVNATKKTEDTSLTTTQIDQREPPHLAAKNGLHQTSLSTTTPPGIVTTTNFF